MSSTGLRPMDDFDQALHRRHRKNVRFAKAGFVIAFPLALMAVLVGVGIGLGVGRLVYAVLGVGAAGAIITGARINLRNAKIHLLAFEQDFDPDKMIAEANEDAPEW